MDELLFADDDIKELNEYFLDKFITEEVIEKYYGICLRSCRNYGINEYSLFLINITKRLVRRYINQVTNGATYKQLKQYAKTNCKSYPALTYYEKLSDIEKLYKQVVSDIKEAPDRYNQTDKNNEGNLPHIEIKTDGTVSSVFINGKKIDAVNEININHVAGNMMHLTLGLVADEVSFDGNLIPDLPDIYKPFYERKHTQNE